MAAILITFQVGDTVCPSGMGLTVNWVDRPDASERNPGEYRLGRLGELQGEIVLIEDNPVDPTRPIVVIWRPPYDMEDNMAPEELVLISRPGDGWELIDMSDMPGVTPIELKEVYRWRERGADAPLSLREWVQLQAYDPDIPELGWEDIENAGWLIHATRKVRPNTA